MGQGKGIEYTVSTV